MPRSSGPAVVAFISQLNCARVCVCVCGVPAFILITWTGHNLQRNVRNVWRLFRCRLAYWNENWWLFWLENCAIFAEWRQANGREGRWLKGGNLRNVSCEFDPAKKRHSPPSSQPSATSADLLMHSYSVPRLWLKLVFRELIIFANFVLLLQSYEAGTAAIFAGVYAENEPSFEISFQAG